MRFINLTLLVVFGFLLQCNVYTALFSRFLRITDVVLLAILPILAISVVTFVPRLLVGLYATLFFLNAFAMVFLSFEPSQGQFYGAFYFFFYAALALVFVFATAEERVLDAFCVGTLFGFVAAAVLLYIDLAGVVDLVPFGLAIPFDAWEAFKSGQSILRLEKAGGLWQQGNEAGPVFALAGAAAAHLAIVRKKLWYLVVYLIVFLWMFTMTLNRSGLIAVTLLVLFVLPKVMTGARLVYLLLGSTVCVIAVAVLLPTGGLDPLLESLESRFLEDANQEQNLDERLISTLSALLLAIQYPFGLGVEARFALMAQIASVRSAHNGFLATAFLVGLLPGLLLFASTIYVLVQGRRLRPFYWFSALVFLVCMFFEELNFNPVFMFTSGLVMAVMATRTLTPGAAWIVERLRPVPTMALSHR